MLRTAIIGTGTMGELHAECFSQIPDVQISAIYSLDKASAQKLARAYDARIFTDEDEFWKFKEMDIVVICTPTSSHDHLAMRALKTGRHVFLEKPVARTLDSARALKHAAAAAKTKLMVGHVLRFFQEYVQARQLLLDGVVGKVGIARTARRGRFPLGFKNWYGKLEDSGGVILDMIIHDLDFLRWCFGEVQQVYAKNLIQRLADNIDYTLITLRFQNGVIAHVEGSWNYEGNFHAAFEIAGRDGLISYHSLETSPIQVLLKKDERGHERVAVPKSPLNESPYLLEDRHFVDCILNDKQPLTGVDEGYEALRIALAALESAATGAVVKL